MSMVFNVDTPDMLKAINSGDQVEFVAEERGTKLFVKQLKKIK
jgi:Cu/Ag efflux protein CusF